MQTVKVDSLQQLNKLYNDSALTVEGLSENSIPDFIHWVKQFTAFKQEVAYVIKGRFMNECYNLTGSNAYPKDLTIVAIMLSDLEKPMALAGPRLSIQARWFDDIVDNNTNRENREEF